MWTWKASVVIKKRHSNWHALLLHIQAQWVRSMCFQHPKVALDQFCNRRLLHNRAWWTDWIVDLLRSLWTGHCSWFALGNWTGLLLWLHRVHHRETPIKPVYKIRERLRPGGGNREELSDKRALTALFSSFSSDFAVVVLPTVGPRPFLETRGKNNQDVCALSKDHGMGQ